MSKRRTWTHDEVLAEAKSVSEILGHFPSVSELRAMKRNDLSVQITRHGGFLAVASEIGVSRIHSDSDTGWAGEIAVATRLESLGFSVARATAVKSPFDLLVNGCVRVDVKTAKFASYGTIRVNSGYFYRIGKILTCDVLILYQSDTGTCYVMPWKAAPTGNITIRATSPSYDQYRENWALIATLAKTLAPLAA